MKNPIFKLLPVLCSLLLFNSCVSNSISKTQRKTDYANSKESSAACFVQLNDGTIYSYSTLKLVRHTFSSPYLLADGKKKFHASDINAYQNKEHYAISQRNFSNGRKSFVAVETLPGFAVRTVKGKMNVYCKKYNYGQVALDEYFIQAGDQAKILAFSAELFNTMVKDNVDAYNFFNSKYNKGSLPEKLHAAANLYNQGQYMSKN